MFSLILFIIILILFVILHYVRVNKLKNKLNNIKDYFNYPMLGVLYIVIRNIRKPITVLLPQVVNEILKNATQTFSLWFGTKLVVVVASEEDLKTVANSPHCYEKDNVYEVFRHNSHKGQGLIYAETNSWKQRRRMLNSSFNSIRFKSEIDKMNKISNNLLNDLEKFSKNKTKFNFFELAMTSTVEIILNLHFNTFLTRDGYRKMRDIVQNTFQDLLKQIICFYSGLPLLYQIKSKFFNYVYSGFHEMIDLLSHDYHINYKNFIENMKDDERFESSLEEIRKKPDSFIERLFRLKYHNYIDDNEIYDQINVLLIAGVDTTAIALSNCILCLAMHQDVQERVYEEINLHLNSDSPIEDITIDIDMIKKMEYLDRVVKESLRILPIVMLVGRRATQDIKLENGTVPAGTDIIIPLYGFHKTNVIWDGDTNKFNPDNFLPEKFEKTRLGFIPFSYGNRNCIAKQQAELYLRMLLIKLIKKYKFKTNLKLENLEFEYKLTSGLSNGYMVDIENR